MKQDNTGVSLGACVRGKRMYHSVVAGNRSVEFSTILCLRMVSMLLLLLYSGAFCFCNDAGAVSPSPQACMNAVPLQLMPPAPGFFERLKAAGYDSATVVDLRTLAAYKRAVGIDQPQPASAPVIGTRPALVLLVDYSDLTHNTVSTPSSYNDLLFSVGIKTPGSMRDYYRAVSYGQFDISGGVDTDWRQVSNAHTYYSNADGVTGTLPSGRYRSMQILHSLSSRWRGHRGWAGMIGGATY